MNDSVHLPCPSLIFCLAVCSLLSRLLQSPADTVQLSLSTLSFIMPWSTNKNHIHLGSTSGHPHTHSYIFFLRLSVRWHSSRLHILVIVSDGCCHEHSRADSSWGRLKPRMGLQSRLLLSLCFPRSHHTVFHTPTLIYILSTADKGSILSTSSSLLFLLSFLWWPFSRVVRWYLWSNTISLAICVHSLDMSLAHFHIVVFVSWYWVEFLAYLGY